MRRRELVIAIGATLALPASGLAAAQPRRLGFLGGGTPQKFSSDSQTALRCALAENGFAEQRDFVVEYRWVERNYEQLRLLAAELVKIPVSLLIANGAAATQAAKAATTTIPIVFVGGFDPIAASFVASLARPGGNATGVTTLTTVLEPKRMQLLRQLVPRARRLAVLVPAENPASPGTLQQIDQAARKQGWQPILQKAETPPDIERYFALFRQQHAEALLVVADPFYGSIADRIVALAAKYRLPGIYDSHDYSDAGGLISYGPSAAAAYERMGQLVAKILKGASPSDLPVEQPTRFDLVVNLKTARALGLTIPPILLAGADEVIE